MARPRQVTDEEILHAFRTCALERGVGVTLDLVAERLGVSPPAVLKRFGSRRALMIAALRPPDEPAWLRDVAVGPDERPFEEQLAALFTRILDVLHEEMPGLVALRESGIPMEECYTDPTATPPPVRGIRALATWLGRARDRGLVAGEDFETAAFAMLGALQGRVFLFYVYKKSLWRRSQRGFVEDLARLFAAALAPDAPTQRRPASHPRRSGARTSPRGVA
jgi:AcrR family transcriptional regulator